MTLTLRQQVLRDARALIANQTHWTRGVLSRAASGRPVMWYDQEACRWCAVGALNRAAYDLVGDRERAAQIADEVLVACFPANLTWINDTQGHAAVLELFNRSQLVFVTADCVHVGCKGIGVNNGSLLGEAQRSP
jgi:hypothetical protein